MTFLSNQGVLFPQEPIELQHSDAASTTFVGNMSLPVHRWFRYSAGFSASWANTVIRDHSLSLAGGVLDPFAGSGTTLLAAQGLGLPSFGLEAHPFVYRVARAKLAWKSNRFLYQDRVEEILELSIGIDGKLDTYPTLIRKCYDDSTLQALDALRKAISALDDGSESDQLAWLTLVGILRKVSFVGTAQWQYVLPNKRKCVVEDPRAAFRKLSRMMFEDMNSGASDAMSSHPVLLQGDARTCGGINSNSIGLVLTSPPYPNNYDYADATRLEMSFFGEVQGWGDLQESVRKYLVRSCSQHVPDKSHSLDDFFSSSDLAPIAGEISVVCRQLAQIRLTKGGRKTYHLMVAAYFKDFAMVWKSLRRVCVSGSKVCFVIGDSAPYGVYVPVIEWMTRLAEAAGFDSPVFEKTRDRNLKWKNRKHRVPLKEGRLWVNG